MTMPRYSRMPPENVIKGYIILKIMSGQEIGLVFAGKTYANFDDLKVAYNASDAGLT